ncbi:hypothetical protein [Natronincola peptidivorans]|uniref:hypothetical protein n=1 Tax=Natronincola peptidivorans TaxID=426128 RepID=UPI0014801F74|nr:hypothetical protein [Natronincola peptidivorans]
MKKYSKYYGDGSIWILLIVNSLSSSFFDIQIWRITNNQGLERKIVFGAHIPLRM